MIAFLLGLVVVATIVYLASLIGGWVSHNLSREQKSSVLGYVFFSIVVVIALYVFYPLFHDLGQFIINFVTIFWAQL